MNAARLTAAKEQIATLLARVNEIPANIQGDRASLSSELAQLLDTVREDVRPHLYQELDTARAEVEAALLPFCEENPDAAARLANETPKIRRLAYAAENFGTPAGVLLADAAKAVATLTAAGA